MMKDGLQDPRLFSQQVLVHPEAAVTLGTGLLIHSITVSSSNTLALSFRDPLGAQSETTRSSSVMTPTAQQNTDCVWAQAYIRHLNAECRPSKMLSHTRSSGKSL
jgi:hypothetical protein